MYQSPHFNRRILYMSILVRRIKRLIVPLLLCFISLLTFPAIAETSTELSVESITPVLNKIERELKLQPTELEDLDTYLDELPTYTVWANTCIDQASSLLKDAIEHVNALGYPSSNEPEEVTATRHKMQANKDSLESKISGCKAILVRSEDAIKKISVFRKETLQRQSFSQGPSIISVIEASILGAPKWVPELVSVLQSRAGIRALSASKLFMLLSIALISLTIAMMIRARLRRWDGRSLSRWQRTQLEGEDTGSRLLAALNNTIRRYVVLIILSLSIALFLSFETRNMVPKPLISIVLDGLPVLLLVYALNYFIFSALGKLGLRKEVDPKTDHALRKRLDLLATIWFLGYLLFQTILSNSLPEAVFFLARAVLGVLLASNVI